MTRRNVGQRTPCDFWTPLCFWREPSCRVTQVPEVFRLRTHERRCIKFELFERRPRALPAHALSTLRPPCGVLCGGASRWDAAHGMSSGMLNGTLGHLASASALNATEALSDTMAQPLCDYETSTGLCITCVVHEPDSYPELSEQAATLHAPSPSPRRPTPRATRLRPPRTPPPPHRSKVCDGGSHTASQKSLSHHPFCPDLTAHSSHSPLFSQPISPVYLPGRTPFNVCRRAIRMSRLCTG